MRRSMAWLQLWLLLCTQIVAFYSSFRLHSSPFTQWRPHLSKLFLKKSQLDHFFPYIANRISPLSITETFQRTCNHDIQCPKSLLLPSLSLTIDKAPTINRFLIANPRTFFLNENIAKAYGCDFDRLINIMTKHENDVPKFKYCLENLDLLLDDLSLLSHILPVLYVADIRPELGMIAFQINSPCVRDLLGEMEVGAEASKEQVVWDSAPETERVPERVGEVLPFLRTFRDKRLYMGGHQRKGNSLVMVHRDPFFPGNRLVLYS